MAPVEIRRRLIAGDPVHFEGHSHEQAADDYMKSGTGQDRTGRVFAPASRNLLPAEPPRDSTSGCS